LAKILIIGVAVGWLSAWLLVELMRRYWIPDFLHNAVFLSAALSVFALSDLMVSESGLVTVTIMGVALANQKKVPVRHVVEFKENLRVLLISCLFVLLAARIQLEDIMALGWGGFAFVVLLIVVIRPLSVFCSTLGTELTWQERTFLSLLAPRGIVAAAVSSVFALEVAKHHQGHAAFPPGDDKLVTLTFLVIVTTVAIYGLSAAPLARWLGLASANPQGLLIAGASAWVRKLAQAIQEEGIDVMLIDTNYRNTAAANLEGIPARCASIVSEYMEEIDLGGIGRLLGMTPNDDLNTLAAVEFANVFGRANVFQLAHGEGNANARRRDVASPMSGRYLFDEDATYSQMAFRIAAGAVVKKTKITDEFAFADFRERYGDDAIVLFVISEHQQLLISTVEQPLEPQSGQTVIAVVNEK
ncbi:MAG: cation:proton antiporter, partial [Pirellulaceae bacterium]|nr:cation:proton antiporter [Pirellulaceae bacterium]